MGRGRTRTDSRSTGDRRGIGDGSRQCRRNSRGVERDIHLDAQVG